MLVDGEREWVEWEDVDLSDEDFPECGAAFERANPDGFDTKSVGAGEAKLFAQRPLVDFAVEWFESNRD